VSNQLRGDKLDFFIKKSKYLFPKKWAIENPKI
jgi:hypothetical protein